MFLLIITRAKIKEFPLLFFSGEIKKRINDIIISSDDFNNVLELLNKLSLFSDESCYIGHYNNYLPRCFHIKIINLWLFHIKIITLWILNLQPVEFVKRIRPALNLVHSL
jgi:hypothetical protein